VATDAIQRRRSANWPINSRYSRRLSLCRAGGQAPDEDQPEDGRRKAFVCPCHLPPFTCPVSMARHRCKAGVKNLGEAMRSPVSRRQRSPYREQRRPWPQWVRAVSSRRIWPADPGAFSLQEHDVLGIPDRLHADGDVWAAGGCGHPPLRPSVSPGPPVVAERSRPPCVVSFARTTGVVSLTIARCLLRCAQLRHRRPATHTTRRNAAKR
jgi:hypothetical protein